MDKVTSKSQISFSPTSNSENKDWELLERIARAFQLKFTSENYSEMESKCFEAALRACKEKNWQIIEKHQEDISKITDIAGRTLFMHAVANWNEDWVSQLLTYKSLVHQKDSEGNTPLHIAAQTGATHLLPMLFKDIGFDSKNNAGETPIHIAIFHGQEGVLKTFLENGANIKLPFIWKSLKVTPLCFAVLRGETGCIDLLLNKDNFQQTIQGIGNILHIATHFHQPHVIEHLLDKYKVLIALQKILCLTEAVQKEVLI